MPHVVVKLFAGSSEQRKSRLAAQLVKDLTAILNWGEESISVAIEEIKAGDWAEKVYNAEIAPNWEELYKKPAYNLIE
ncbi:MAG TPA: tautomerase family protein [Chthoniobacterales bacterium]|nr:tautomerase family protein [Chthoniobacterales bacterium]